MGSQKKGEQLCCHRCLYVWPWNGDNFWRVNCPKCGTTVTPHKAVVNKKMAEKIKDAQKEIESFIKKVKTRIFINKDS